MKYEYVPIYAPAMWFCCLLTISLQAYSKISAKSAYSQNFGQV